MHRKELRHALASLGFTALGIGSLVLVAPTEAAPLSNPVADGCNYRVEVALTEALEGVYAPDGWEVQEGIMLDACEQLGSDASADIYEDGSWRVESPTTHVYWIGCVSTEAPCAEEGM